MAGCSFAQTFMVIFVIVCRIVNGKQISNLTKFALRANVKKKLKITKQFLALRFIILVQKKSRKLVILGRIWIHYFTKKIRRGIYMKTLKFPVCTEAVKSGGAGSFYGRGGGEKGE